MRKLSILLSLLPFLTKAQSLSHHVFLAPNFSFYASAHPDVYPDKGRKSISYWGFGGASGYGITYDFPRTFSLGASMECLVTSAQFYTPCYCIHTADRTITVRHVISSNSLDIPVFLKIRTNKNEQRFTYLQAGGGGSWLFYTYRKVEEETHILSQGYQNPIREPIKKEAFALKNNKNNGFGTFFQLEIGQNFQLAGRSFFTSLSYRGDLNP